MDLKQNEKAEEALNKAIQLDPDFADAQYQLGAHLLGVASGIREEASRLKFGDPTYDKLLAKSDEVYKKALVPLEAYISKIPNDKTVLTILFQIHKSLKNTEKALEFKKRADAAQ
jgi:tetratricopeptide (TPR) repeat protein